MKHLLILLPFLAAYLTGCADQSERMEEPVKAEPESSSDEEADEEAGEDAAGDPMFESAPQPDMQDDAVESDTFDGEAAEDMDAGSVEEPAAAAPAEPAPNEKGGIISSGVKPKPAQRCNLIEDDIERRRCLMKHSKKKRGN